MMKSFSAWRVLKFTRAEFRCEETLQNGQCFGWLRKNPEQRVWIGVLHDKIVEFEERNDDVRVRYYPDCGKNDFDVKLDYYLHSDVNLNDLISQWKSDQWFEKIAPYVVGVRLLRQSPIECLFSFITSSNNNISRITKLMSSLRKFGDVIGVVDDVIYHQFPTLDQLSLITVDEFSKLGFGYRAKYIAQTVKILIKLGGSIWLDKLKNDSPEKVKSELQQLSGVGPKVADCVSLFCLDQFSVVPIDVHMFNVTLKHYSKELPAMKTLSPKLYGLISELYQKKFGNYCGWAHSIIFLADLPVFAARIPQMKRKLDQI